MASFPSFYEQLEFLISEKELWLNSEEVSFLKFVTPKAAKKPSFAAEFLLLLDSAKGFLALIH